MNRQALESRTGKCIVSLESHKHTVNHVEWNRNGKWLLTASRDQQCKLFDIRMINEELDAYFHERGHIFGMASDSRGGVCKW